MTFTELRKKHRYSRRQLAEAMGYKNQATIAKWEDGSSMPTAGKIPKLAQLLNVTVSELYDTFAEQIKNLA